MSRRGENIYKRKDGRWEGRYIKGRNSSNKAIYGYVYGKSYSEVKEKLVGVKHVKEQPRQENEPDFTHIAQNWYQAKKLNVKHSSLIRYKSLLDNHILPLLGEYKISYISTVDIQRYINYLAEQNYASKTISDFLSVTKNIFTFAERSGIKAPVALNSLYIKTHKYTAETLSEAEVTRLCRYILSNLSLKSFGVLLCICTGIRIGELCALKWQDINISEKSLSVNKTLIRIASVSEVNRRKTEIMITSPKTESAKRKIPLQDSMMAYISKLKGADDAFVLTGSDKPLEPRNMQYYFTSLLKCCDIRHYKFHALRHTFATRCVESGVEIKSLSEILGHSSVKITLDKYVHSSMDLKRKQMEKISFI